MSGAVTAEQTQGVVSVPKPLRQYRTLYVFAIFIYGFFSLFLAAVAVFALLHYKCIKADQALLWGNIIAAALYAVFFVRVALWHRRLKQRLERLHEMVRGREIVITPDSLRIFPGVISRYHKPHKEISFAVLDAESVTRTGYVTLPRSLVKSVEIFDSVGDGVGVQFLVVSMSFGKPAKIWVECSEFADELNAAGRQMGLNITKIKPPFGFWF